MEAEEPENEAEPSRSWRRYLAWQIPVALLVLSVPRLTAELMGLDRAALWLALSGTTTQREAYGLRRLAAAQGLPDQELGRLAERIRLHCPEEAMLLLLVPTPLRPSEQFAFELLQNLVFPRSLLLLDRLPEGWRAMAAGTGKAVFVLELPPKAQTLAPEAERPLVACESWRLWRVRGESGR
ncbi:MAG: hypothetical protein CSA62_01485 [Planctomycetota bacterium]|nr:MAG: hypothetical protein CSA62_01485 [Planctomycetota bacterium]